MILVIGGYGQGKRAFVRKIFGIKDADIAEGAFCSVEDVLRWGAVSGLHVLIRRMLEGECDLRGNRILAPLSFFEAHIGDLRDKIFISDEIGLGIVPVDALERQWREMVGRVCCLLAREADEVYRVCAGMGVRIKG